MAPENGSTRHRSYFTLAEGDDALMETAEVPKIKHHKLNMLVKALTAIYCCWPTRNMSVLLVIMMREGECGDWNV